MLTSRQIHKCVTATILITAVSTVIYLSCFNDLHQYYRHAFTTRPRDSEPLITSSDYSDDRKPLEVFYDNVPNLPDYYRDYAKPKSGSDGCHLFPSVFHLRINNDNWQLLETSLSTAYIFGAYYDDRARNPAPSGASVRMTVMHSAVNASAQRMRWFCQLWYDNAPPVSVPVVHMMLMWYTEWGQYGRPGKRFSGLYPYLVTCDVPKTGEYREAVPSAVSLVEEPCDSATNALKVINNRRPSTGKNPTGPPSSVQQRPRIAICVKGLDFPKTDLSLRLIEWIEMLRILGAQRVNFYNLDAHDRIMDALDYYERQKDDTFEVNVASFSLAGGQPNYAGFQHEYLRNQLLAKRHEEVIAYTDCLYKNMYEFDYVALLDVDELIIPHTNATWPDLMSHLQRSPPNTTTPANADMRSHCFQHVYFPQMMPGGASAAAHSLAGYDALPAHHHVLRRLVRTRNFTAPGFYVKCMHNARTVTALHNHYPFACLPSPVQLAAMQRLRSRSANGSALARDQQPQPHHDRVLCDVNEVDKEVAQLNHYRDDCVKGFSNCADLQADTVLDVGVWRWHAELIQRVRSVAASAGLL